MACQIAAFREDEFLSNFISFVLGSDNGRIAISEMPKIKMKFREEIDSPPRTSVNVILRRSSNSLGLPRPVSFGNQLCGRINEQVTHLDAKKLLLMICFRR